MRFGLAAVLSLLIALLGCDGEETVVEPADAGPSPDAAVDPIVTEPAIPWLEDGVPVTLTPCPEGWREVPGAVVECDPYPEAGPEDCAAGEAHFPGEVGCRTIGDACPAGDYADDAPTTGNVVFVNATASAGGDGSRGAPYASLAEAAPVVAGTTLVLGKGTFPGTLALPSSVTVLGACARETILTGAAGPAPAAVISTGSTGPPELRNLTIDGPPTGGVRANDGRALLLSGVVIAGAVGPGVILGARSRVEMHDVVVRGCARGGVVVNLGAELITDRVLMSSNAGVGIISAGAGNKIDIADTAIIDTDGNPGAGLLVADGTEVSAARLLVAGSGSTGIAVTDATARVEDTVVRGSRSATVVTPGVAVFGGSLEASRLLIAENRGIGFTISRGQVVLTDTVIRDTLSTGSLGTGYGLTMGDVGRLEAQRMLLKDNAEVAVYAAGESTISLTDVAVIGTRARPSDLLFGRGIEINGGVVMEATRLVLEGNRDASLFIEGEGTSAVMNDALIRDTLSVEGTGIWGRGAQVQRSAHLGGSRVRVEGSRDIAVVAAGAEIRLTDLALAGVTAADCVAAGGCLDGPYGYGVTAASSVVTLTRFTVEGAPTCGIFLAPIPGEGAPEVDLSVGRVRASGIGACVQVDGYDLMRLSDDVEYLDNGKNLDSTSLPVPGITGP